MSWTDTFDISDISNAANTILGTLIAGGVIGTAAGQRAVAARQATATGTAYAAGAPVAPADWSTILLIAGLGVLVLAILLSRKGG